MQHAAQPAGSAREPISSSAATSAAGLKLLKQRMPALDMLRGVASLAVAWYHFYCFSALPGILRLPFWADQVLRHGFFGVEVFFVLSGVVISLSITGAVITWRYVGRFALRRSIRLDPPYWATLTAACLIDLAIRKPPRLPQLLAHLVYLQNILGYGNIVSQFWTLCYEVQFYLILVLFVALAQRAGRFAGWILAVSSVTASLVMLALHADAGGWFIDWWYAFAAGAATTGMLTGKLSKKPWAGGIGIILLVGIVSERPVAVVVAITALAIGLAGLAGKLWTWTGGPVLQWLGRISYSLYLLHFLATAFARLASGRIHSRAGGAAIFLGATAIALLSAECLYRLIERPAQSFSKKIRL
jgi:peptidoglycan/LPS O-acetylase OafA/YrhL